MAVYLSEYVTDLGMPPMVHPVPHQFAMGDNNAYTFTALLCDHRDPDAELMSGTVSGELLRPDGETVALEGTKGAEVRRVNLDAGGMCNATPCSVTLPQACFAYPGRVTLTIKLTDGTTITQALAVSAVVVRTSTDVVVDPGEVIPDIGAIQAAAAEALEAAADATEAAEAASTAMAGSVRFDQAQTLTDAQKTTARGNIAAASLVTSGTAFSQATQGGTTYDVQDTVARNASECPFPVEGWGPPCSVTKNGVTVSKDSGRRMTINGTTTGTGSYYLFEMSNGGKVNNMYNVDDKGVNPSAVLHAGRIYEITATIESGSVTQSGTAGNSSYRSNLELITHGATAGYAEPTFTINIGADYANGIRFYRKVLWPTEDLTIGFGLYLRYSVTFSNLVIAFNVRDVSNERIDDSIATVDYPMSALSDHASGSLLMLGSHLYKATSAIAAGETIGSGSGGNVTPTSVATELAARDTAIAAEATARAAEDTAISTFNGLYPSTAWGSGGTDTTYGVTITAVRNRVTINGTRTGTNTGVNYSFLNGITKTTGSSGADVEGDTLVSENFVAKAGHKYRFTMRVLSGSYTKGSGGSSFRLYKKAGTADVSHDVFVWNQSITSPAEYSFVEAFTADTQLGIGMFMGSNAGAFSSLVIEYSVVDETNTLPTKPSSDGTYTLQCVVSGGVPTYSWISAT